MRRALVLTTESARHPFRQRLPLSLMSPPPLPEPPAREPMTDLAFFFASFAAGFVVFMGLII